ncbi:MAG: tetratricopeptide repeat protein [Verrucomicrobiota bacterium]
MAKKRKRPQKSPRLIGALILAFVVISIAYYSLSYLRLQQEESIQSLIAEKKHQEAGKQIDRLLFVWREDPALLRLRALTLRSQDPQEALKILETLIGQDGSKDLTKNVYLYSRIALENDQPEKVLPILEKLPLNDRSSAKAGIFRTRAHAALGDYKAALDAINSAIDVAPEHAEALLVKGQLLLVRGRVTDSVQAKAVMRNAGQKNTSIGLAALLELATHPGIRLFPTDRRWLRNRMQIHPERTSYSDILAATQSILLGDREKSEVIEEEIARNGKEHPELLIAWLMGIGEPQQAKDFAVKLPADKQQLIDITFVEAEIRLGNLQEAAIYVENHPDIPLLYRKTLKAILPDTSPEDDVDNWLEAFKLAGEKKNVHALTALSRHAASQREWDKAQQGYLSAIEFESNPVGLLQLSREAAVVSFYQRNTAQAVEHTQRILEIDPTNGNAINNLAYLKGLLGVIDNELLESLKSLDRRADDSRYATTLSFLAAMSGDVKEAERKYREIPKQLRSDPSIKLLSALIEFKKQNEAPAVATFTAAEIQELLPEELALWETITEKQ